MDYLNWTIHNQYTYIFDLHPSILFGKITQLVGKFNDVQTLFE